MLTDALISMLMIIHSFGIFTLHLLQPTLDGTFPQHPPTKDFKDSLEVCRSCTDDPGLLSSIASLVEIRNRQEIYQPRKRTAKAIFVVELYRGSTLNARGEVSLFVGGRFQLLILLCFIPCCHRPKPLRSNAWNLINPCCKDATTLASTHPLHRPRSFLDNVLYGPQAERGVVPREAIQ